MPCMPAISALAGARAMRKYGATSSARSGALSDSVMLSVWPLPLGSGFMS
jgi:hypothetical protein